MKITLHCPVILFLLSLSVTANAGNQDAHVHGAATLTLALENETLEIQFETPAANLVGFEHKAKSSEEKQRVKKAEGILSSPKQLFSFADADCKSTDTSVDVSGLVGDDHDHHHHHHDHSKGHSEIKAQYRFVCKNAGKLKSVSIALFEPFPGIEKINTMWVTDSKQGSKLLNPQGNTFSLR